MAETIGACEWNNPDHWDCSIRFSMNEIIKTPITSLGYNFVDTKYIPRGKDEYYMRNLQNTNKGAYRNLTHGEIRILHANGNTCDNWEHILVNEVFDPSLVQLCKFHGLVRIGKLEPYYLQFHDVRQPVGLYNSSIISCDLGDNVVINNVNYLSHYIIGNEVIIVNVNEIEVSDHAKFGNGIIRKGEKESVRIWLELCNENGGRSVMPFNGMQTGDAYLWTRHRGDAVLMQKFKEFTEKKFDDKRGYYGMIGDRTVIKNSRIIKDVMIGTDAYIKGANKLKNLTINSSAESPTQIGEGCEMVNGIIGFGCKAFYGVKAVRFILASHSQLKYGARLINSFLGDNSTISCCEVLNSLLFPAHEQHHNNSFLCASVVMGQSNMAAGATIGSNHNSRGADGEIIAGRGFWPGLCVSLKHNSRFASFTLMAKGDYPAELNIRIPFSLVSNDISRDRLLVMPGYWFMYNMYALARNSGKYEARDKRAFRNQHLEYGYLAPDSINEMFDALREMSIATGKAIAGKSRISPDKLAEKGSVALEKGTSLKGKEVLLEGVENSNRPVVLLKPAEAYNLFRELISYYAALEVIRLLEQEPELTITTLTARLAGVKRTAWCNIGGQLIPKPEVDRLIRDIHNGTIDSWDAVHNFYHETSAAYPEMKMQHALASLLELNDIKPKQLTAKFVRQLLNDAVSTREWMVEGIYSSRAKDYESPFRKMVYETNEEMEQVIGALEDNSFIRQQREELVTFRDTVRSILKKL